jgi:hypothetical protein
VEEGVVMCVVVWGLVLGAAAAYGDQYWFDFEFNDPNDLPNGDGWARHFAPQAFGVVQDGVLTYDSNDPQSYDYFEYHRPGALDPGPHEIFLFQWKLWVEWVSYWGDPGVSVMSDDGWVVMLIFDVNVIHSFHEYEDIPIPPGAWHVYTLVSTDMRFYDLYADASLIRHGWFADRFITSCVQFGDLGQGPTSGHHWDFLRFGVMPDPETLTGDLNCDGTVDFRDINPFVQALADPAGYETSYPACPVANRDINADGSVDFGDINPFIELLVGS